MEIETSRVHEHFNDRKVDSDSAPVVYNDSQGVVSLSKNPVRHNASKHIDVQYHFVLAIEIDFSRIDFSSFDPDRFGLSFSDLADSNETTCSTTLYKLVFFV